MKYATLTILYLLFICLYGCGSHKNNMDKTVQESTSENKTEVHNSKISVNQSLLDVHRSATQTDIDEDITTIFFDSLGNIRTIQSAKRSTRRNELADSSRRLENDSLVQKNDSTNTHSETNIEIDEHRESEGDSRPVQGFAEWAAILFTALIAVAIIVGMIIYKIRKK